MSDGEGSKVVRRTSVTSNNPDGKDQMRRASKTDFEAVMEKIPYPKAVFFIIVCEFCERFCYYGMRAVLTLYFKNALKWDEDFSTVIFHVWAMFCYLTPLIGAMLADSLLGKFRTIFYLSLVYCAGSVVLSLAATPPLNIPTVAFSMIGLALIAIGTGGIKPCVSAFGGDQFKIPGQEAQLESFFAVFYFSINSGSLITQIVTPILREDVSCFGDDTCYPFAFALPAALMIIALAVFLIGRPLYTIVKPQGNIVLKVLQAVKHSFSRKGTEIKAGRKREHWLDYADDKFDQRFLDEAKVVFKVLFLYIPLPIFWTLFDQQGSRWTFQATRMNGHIAGGFSIKPDQMQVINPILVLIFIPLFDRVIYPVLGKCGLLKKPLQRLGVGLVFAGISFVVSGVVELFLVPTYAVELSRGESNFQLVNGLPCGVRVSAPGLSTVNLGINEMEIYEAIETNKYVITATPTSNRGCGGLDFSRSLRVPLVSEEAHTFVLHADPLTKEVILSYSEAPDELEKSETGLPKFRILYFGFEEFENVTFTLESDNDASLFLGLHEEKGTETRELEPKTYKLVMTHSYAPDGVIFSTDIDLKLGGSYVSTIVARHDAPSFGNETDYFLGFHEITSPNSVHMAWLIPQFVVMTCGEIMFSITIMDFSYTEAPPSMKSVMQSAWLMTVAVGNLIVVIIAEAKIFDQQYKEFFLFAGIMFADVIIYAYLAYLYKPTEKFWETDKKKDKEIQGKDNASYTSDD